MLYIQYPHIKTHFSCYQKIISKYHLILLQKLLKDLCVYFLLKSAKYKYDKKLEKGRKKDQKNNHFKVILKHCIKNIMLNLFNNI